MWIGRAFVSTTAWSLVEKPPRERPKALRRTPLFRPTHPDVRERRNHRRSNRSHRPRAEAPGKSWPSDPSWPSLRTGYRRSSTVQIARVNRAMAIRSWLGRARPPRTADLPGPPSDRSLVAAEMASDEPTGRRSKRVGACRSLITATIAAQVPSATIVQVIEMIYVFDPLK